MSEHSKHCAKLVSLAVHEFRTPTAVVSGYLRMLLRHFGENLTEQQRRLLEESEKSCGAIARLLSDFADLAQLEEGAVAFKREPLSLWPLLRDVASSVQEGRDRGVTLQVDVPDEEILIEGDRARLAQAVDSVMAAVLRERQDGARVVAAARVQPQGSGRSAVIAFGDPERAGAVADAFDSERMQQFDEYRGGLGFRLPAAARVIEAHGGRLASPVSERGRLVIVMALPAHVARVEGVA